MKNFLLIILSVATSSVGQIMLKYGANKTNEGVEGLLKYINLSTIIGLFFYAGSALLWMVVLRRVELSYAYPMVSLGYVIIVIASYFLFGESVNMFRVVGLITIVIGVIFIAKS